MHAAGVRQFSGESIMGLLPRKALSSFIQGLLALLPLLVCGWAVLFVVRFIEGIADNILVLFPREINELRFLRFLIELISAASLFIGISIFGIVVRTVLGKSLLRFIENFFAQIPGLNRIYRSTKQTVEIIWSGKNKFLTRPVLVEYPSPGIWAVAFNTGDAGQAFDRNGRKYSTVFIPTTPNPTSGFLAVIPSEKLSPLDISTEEAIRMILTGGIVKKPPPV
jgi:uncharacterized membrane protein